jgi:hypothetical protein
MPNTAEYGHEVLLRRCGKPFQGSAHTESPNDNSRARARLGLARLPVS